MGEPIIVSICMITYNHKNYIEEAINGVLMQECDFYIELIISNDNSPDATHEIIQNIIDKHPKGFLIKYFKQEKNLGANANSIFALNQCKGKYIALCEGDDYWIDKLKLQKQIDFLEVNKEYVLCFHEVNILMPNGKIVEDFITKVPENHETIETLSKLGNYIHTPSVVFKNILKEFPFEFKVTPIGDYFLYIMLAEHGKLKYLKETMAVYRYGVGFFSTISTQKKALANLKLLICLLSYLDDSKIKEIIYDRYLYSLNNFEFKIRNEYNQGFVLNNKFFRIMAFIKNNFFFPKKVIKKIYNEFLEKK